MKTLNNILVIIEPKRDYQEALARAVEFSKINPQATITALRVAYDFTTDPHLLSKLKEKQTKDDVSVAYLEQVNKTIDEYKNDQSHIVPKVIFSKDIAEGIIKELQENHYDLVIKGANRHGILDSIFFTPIDWQLLRHSNAPVLIAKNKGWQDNAPIVVALDFSSAQKKLTNLTILREAQLFAKLTKGEIHLVNSAPVMLPTIMLEVPHYAPEVYAQNIINEHKKRLIEFARQHNIKEDHCHVEDGMPDDVIPKLCKRIKAKAVFLGSAGRSGTSAALIGNTCEEIVDYIDADLFVINYTTLKKHHKQI